MTINPFGFSVVSIHAPTRGATIVTERLCRDKSCFYPRSHEGSDVMTNETENTQNVSIHAPTRGATMVKERLCRDKSCFNPRSHEGSDAPSVLSYAITGTFQSTLPRGERLTAHFVNSVLKVVSIHAPTRGATSHPLLHIQHGIVSIHAPTRGATKIAIFIFRVYNKFQSTLPRGERRKIPSLSLFHVTVSIHAPTRGATRTGERVP